MCSYDDMQTAYHSWQFIGHCDHKYTKDHTLIYNLLMVSPLLVFTAVYFIREHHILLADHVKNS